MKNPIPCLLLLILLIPVGLSAQVVVPFPTISDTPTIANAAKLIAGATVDTTDTQTAGAAQAETTWQFGTVVGSYTACTVQLNTSNDGVTFYKIGPAIPITVSTSANNAWTVTAPMGSSPSSTTAQSFFRLTKGTLACTGYGTSAPVTIRIVYIPSINGSNDPCITGPFTQVDVNNAAATSFVLVSGGTGLFTHFCGGLLVFASAVNAVVLEGTGGAACPTGTAGISGGTTTGTGWNLTANGVVLKDLKTLTAGDDVCMVLASAVQVSGHLKVVKR